MQINLVKNFDEDSLATLAESIKNLVFSIIVVRKQKNKYQIVAE